MGLILKATMYTAIGLFVLGSLPIIAMTIIWIGYTVGNLIKNFFKNWNIISIRCNNLNSIKKRPTRDPSTNSVNPFLEVST